MEKLPEFIQNHPYLITALFAISIVIIVLEYRRRVTGASALTTTAAVQLMNNQSPLILDIRDQAEYKAGHILNAKSVPLAELTTQADKLIADKTKPVIIYCKTGSQSPAASKILRNAGYTQLYTLRNGLLGWQQDSLPLTKTGNS